MLTAALASPLAQTGDRPDLDAVSRIRDEGLKRSQVMATMRNIAISLLRLTGWKNIKQATEKMSRRVGQILTLLGV